MLTMRQIVRRNNDDILKQIKKKRFIKRLEIITD